MTGLKVNSHKSCVYYLSRCEEMGMKAATILNCTLGSLLFTYLGLPIKVITLRREDWQPLIERVEKRLTTWKGNALSRGGDSSLWTPFYPPCPSTSCCSFTFRSGWIVALIVSVVLSFEKAPRAYMVGFAWLSGNLFALLKMWEVWEFATFEPLILLFFPSGGGVSSMTRILCEWLLSFITTIEEEILMIGTVLLLDMSLFFEEESSRLPWPLPLTSKLKWEMVPWKILARLLGVWCYSCFLIPQFILDLHGPVLNGEHSNLPLPRKIDLGSSI